MTEEADIESDVVVVGGGMAGLTAAAVAARRGCRVIVLEKGGQIGGSAVLAHGAVWTPMVAADHAALDPGARHDLVALAVDGLPAALEWVASLGVAVGPPIRRDGTVRYPALGPDVDVLGYLERCRSIVVQAGGHVVLGATASGLRRADRRVTGVVVEDRDGRTTVGAATTVLASGGFQADPDLRVELIGSHAASLVLRSNAESDGAGLRLARAAGGAVRRSDHFYGNLLPVGLDRAFDARDWTRLAQYHSVHSLLLDRTGRRLGDEKTSYYGNAVLVSRTPGGRALLVGDRAVRRLGRAGAHGDLDRIGEAQASGCPVVEAATLAELDEGAAALGYAGVAAAVDALAAAPEERRPLDEPPWFALEVQSAITFPFAGLVVDGGLRVLDDDGGPVPGLLAAGSDVHLVDRTYAGGLAFALVSGTVAGRAAADA